MTALVAGRYVWCVDLDGETIDFFRIMYESNTPWGTLVGNLHLLPTSHGHGVGKRLVGEAARWTVAQGIIQLHLLAYEVSTAAIGFYEALGGVPVSRDWLETVDGGHAWIRTHHQPEAEFEDLTCLP